MAKYFKLFVFIAACALLFGGARVYYALTDDFRLANMTHELDFEAPWKVPALSQEEQKKLNVLLDQKFYYIGKGAQCYAFSSSDGEYVIKFFKFKHLRPSIWVNLLPSIPPFTDYKQAAIERKRNKLISVFEGYDLAYHVNKEDSRLIYLHLIPTDRLFKQVSVMDKLGREHRIDLDKVVFLVQKKGETLRTRMTRLLVNGQVQAAKESMSQILAMYRQEYKKGVYDRDHGVMHNTGFVKEAPFHLDVGKFTDDKRMMQPEFFTKDLEHVAWKMDIWVKRTFPGYYPDLSSHLASEFFKLTGTTFDVSTIDPAIYKKRRHGWGLGG